MKKLRQKITVWVCRNWCGADAPEIPPISAQPPVPLFIGSPGSLPLPGMTIQAVSSAPPERAANPRKRVLCRDCAFWDTGVGVNAERGWGECHRYAPASEARGLPVLSTWPNTKAAHWCGDGELREAGA